MAALVWDAVGAVGVPLVVRCLAAWWRVHDELQPAGHSPEPVAASLLCVVGAHARVPAAKDAAASIAARAARAEVEAGVRSALALSPRQLW